MWVTHVAGCLTVRPHPCYPVTWMPTSVGMTEMGGTVLRENRRCRMLRQAQVCPKTFNHEKPRNTV